MIPSDLPAVLHAMRQAVDEAAPDLAFVEISYGGPGEVLPITERLVEAAVNALPALIEHAGQVLADHNDHAGLCGTCSEWLTADVDWPCDYIDGLCSLLTPYSTLLEEKK